MGKNSAIEWTDHTQNFWRGCHKKSTGCLNCYWFRDAAKFGHDPTQIVRARPHTFNAPLTWGNPALVFTCSWSDFFLEEADPWRDDAWEIIRQTSHLMWLILTKRPELIPDRLPADWDGGWPNVALMVSAENQEWLDERVSQLLNVPAQMYGASLEPLLEPVDTSFWLRERGGGFFPNGLPRRQPILPANWHQPKLNWLIVGGESDYHNPRPMDLDWVRAVIADGKKADVPVFVKQLGTAWAREHRAKDWKGGNPTEWPEDLRVREFRKVL